MSFSVTVDGLPAPTLRWQLSTDGGSVCVDLQEGGAYGGTATTTLSVSPVALEMDGYRFRAVAENSAGATASTAALLTVKSFPSKPVFTSQPVDRAASAGAEVIFAASADAIRLDQVA